MKTILIPLLTALVIGILVGMLSMWNGNIRSGVDPMATAGPDLNTRPLARMEAPSQALQLQQLRHELEQVKSRLAELETALQDNTDPQPANITQENPAAEAGPVDPLNMDNLIEAGVSNALAADIMRRQGELEYKKLQLRDKAIREGYIRNARYYRELRELNQQQLSLREEIGDPAYDKYLYQTGQNNRVQVSSVMAGSPAAVSGIEKDDIILSYANKPVFTWNEMRRETSEGDLGEYVTVDILRDGERLSLMLPRGPLGVKLNPARSEPRYAY